MRKIILLILCLSLIFAFGCGGDEDTPIQPPQTFNIEYSVTSQDSLSVDISYYQEKLWFDNHVELPWHYEFVSTHDKHLYLEILHVYKASLSGEHSITIEIYKDGNRIKSDSCYGNFNDPNALDKCGLFFIDIII